MFQLKPPYQNSDRIIFVDTIFDPVQLMQEVVGMLNRKKTFYIVIGINIEEQLVRGVGEQFLKIARVLENHFQEDITPRPIYRIGYISHEEIPLILVKINPELEQLNDDAYYLKESNPYGFSWVRYYRDLVSGSSPITRELFREKQVEENYKHNLHCQALSGRQSDKVRHLIDQRKLVGTLHGQVEDVLQFVKRNISYTTTWQYPIEVIRGMIEFLIITRNYQSDMQTSIEVLSDSVKMSAPIKTVKKEDRAKENYLLKEYLFEHNIHRYEKLSDVGYFLDNHEECTFQSYQEDGMLHLLLQSTDKSSKQTSSLSEFVSHLSDEHTDKSEGVSIFDEGAKSLEGLSGIKDRTDDEEQAIAEIRQDSSGKKRSIKKMLSIMIEPRKAKEIMADLNLKDRETFYNNYLNPALQAGFIEQTIPDKPRSPKQRYVITKLGREQLEDLPF